MNKMLWTLLLGSTLTACGSLKKALNPEKEKRQQNGLSSQISAKPLMLRGFSSCIEADLYLQEGFRQQIKQSLDHQQFMMERYDDYYEKAAAPDSISSAERSNGAAGSSAGPEAFSRTNTQVASVDEPDIMKTDGKLIFTLSGSNVQIAQSWPASELRKISEIRVDGAPQGLMLTEKQKLIVVYHPHAHANQGGGQDFPSSGAAPASAPWIAYSYPDHQITRLAIYDVSQAQTPKLEKQLTFFGSYLSMRRQGDMLRLIQSENYLSFPAGLSLSVPLAWDQRGRPKTAEFKAQRAAVERANEAILQKLTLTSYLADIRQTKKGFSFDDPILSEIPDCQKLLAEEQMNQAGLSKVTSINLGSFEVSQLSLLAPANHIYSSESSLYLAHTHSNWWWGWGVRQGAKTYLHKLKYDSQGSTNMSYEGSGMVDGYILNQFAMDEHRDHLRVAVTDDNAVERMEAGQPIFTTSNRIYTLTTKDKKLELVGQTPDLAPGERIYSARFVGDKGYVVTFRQVDPLFTLDLSNPAEPKVLGELKIPGFSNYMHPVSENLLLAVGQNADPNTGRVQGLKISLFDVSNPTQPKEAHSFSLGNMAWSWSDAQYDHKAFTYFASRGLLGIPVGGYRRSTNSMNWWDSYFSELMVFHIDPVKGITSKGSISMHDIYRGSNTEWSYWWYGAQVSRSVFADDYIYAISDLGIRAVHQSNLSAPLATVSFYP